MIDGETAEIYARAAIGGSLMLGSAPAVLVVDFSRGFTDPNSTLGADLTAAVEATRSLLHEARNAAVPVIFTTIAFEPNLGDGGIWLQKMPALAELKLGSRWVQLDPRLERREEETLIVKKGASALFGTNLAALLAAGRIDTVILCGATTSGCVRATAVDLLQSGYPTIVPRECVGDRAPAPHEANLLDIDAKYADVVPLAAAIAYLHRSVVGAPTPA
jgi:nicotinamidase-related amidase